MTAVPAYVMMVAPGQWVLAGAGSFVDRLSGLDAIASVEGDRVTLNATDKDDATAARIAEDLRDLGLPFGAGKDWSPAAYVSWLKERGLAQGEFTEIYWTTPRQWRLRHF